MTCNNQQCNIDEVGRTVCTHGCVDGYRGISCRIHCPVNCLVCERLNGSCITSHLICTDLCQGFRCHTDQTCSKTTCLDGRYGQNCSNKCYPRYLTCARSTGDCTACRDGYYGQNCEHDCPPCSFTRGSMDQICKDGCKTTPCTDTTPGDSGNTVLQRMSFSVVLLVLVTLIAMLLLRLRSHRLM
ncbi:scavenger receptor class F member 1-like [Haliotis rufescens]|uniref:scavenger receptor class F member 1-like n=1 Tax=Haliotis rufescens TaxID=6454 RepID=UPI00201E8D81|nr:scavenger receptor class F member 1-like [Haliotis rufescens]